MPAVTVIAAISAAASIATGVLQYSQSKKAARARKEQQAIASASDQNRLAEERARAARQLRIKRASLLQQAEQTGVGASSGALGSSGILNTNYGSVISQSNAQASAAAGISAASQQEANAISRGQMYGTLGGIFGAVGSFATSTGGRALVNDLFGPSQPTTLANPANLSPFKSVNR